MSAVEPFHSVIESLPAGAYICDRHGLITAYNQHAVEVWGRAPRLRDPADRFCGSFQLRDARGNPIRHEDCWMALALRNNREYLGEEIVVDRADGSSRRVLAHATPIRDGAGALVGAMNVLVDVTDRERVHSDRALLAAIVSSSDDAIVSETLEGHILSWNAGAERLFGYNAAEVVGRPISLIIPEDLAGEEEEMLARVRRGERVEHYETVRQARDGHLLDVSLTLSPVFDACGRVIAASKIARDISPRKRADEERAKLLAELQRRADALAEAAHRKDQFLALLAHELRNPLAPLRNGLQVMRLAPYDGPAVGKARMMMERQLGHLVRLVDDLLDLSRLGQNRLNLQRSQVTLAEVVEAGIETARPLVDTHGQELRVSLPPQPVYLDADPTRLAQVLSNLLSNAARYTPAGGGIELIGAVRDQRVEISVRDTGIGIPAESLPTVFEMFAQVDRSVERASGGLGIGLALAKGLVEMHGGTISASSDGPGRGSTFTVSMPLLAAHPEPPTLHPEERPEVGPSRRVLVVDDNRDAASSMAMMLELLGNEVRLAHDGLQALDAAEAFRPQVVLMDVGMPRLDGLEAARRLRQAPWGRDLTIVALTGYGQDSDKERSRDAGCDAHLVKPIDLKDLEQLLTNVA